MQTRHKLKRPLYENLKEVKLESSYTLKSYHVIILAVMIIQFTASILYKHTYCVCTLTLSLKYHLRFYIITFH